MWVNEVKLIFEMVKPAIDGRMGFNARSLRSTLVTTGVDPRDGEHCVLLLGTL